MRNVAVENSNGGLQNGVEIRPMFKYMCSVCQGISKINYFLRLEKRVWLAKLYFYILKINSIKGANLFSRTEVSYSCTIVLRASW